MANIRGKSRIQDVIVSWKDSQAKGPWVYATAQIDQSHVTQKSVKEGTVRPDTNPYLTSIEKEANGQKFVDHTFKYAASQIEAMKAAGQFESKDGLNCILVKGALSSKKDPETKKSMGMFVNTSEPLGPSDNKWTPIYALNKQTKLTAVAKEQAKKERENTANTPDVQQENQAQTEAEAPDFA